MYSMLLMSILLENQWPSSACSCILKNGTEQKISWNTENTLELCRKLQWDYYSFLDEVFPPLLMRKGCLPYSPHQQPVGLGFSIASVWRGWDVYLHAADVETMPVGWWSVDRGQHNVILLFALALLIDIDENPFFFFVSKWNESSISDSSWKLFVPALRFQETFLFGFLMILP